MQMFVLWVAGIKGVGEQNGKWVTALDLLPRMLLNPWPLHNCGTAVLVFFTRVLPSVE